MFLYTFLYTQSSTAIISKVRGNVKYKDEEKQKYIKSIDVNSLIDLDSHIMTDKKAFVKMIFLDDGSRVSIYPETEIVVKGSHDKRRIIKDIEILYGLIKVEIVNQDQNQFQLFAPNSKLNCNECEFWLQSNQKGGDKYIKLGGDFDIFNSSINKSSNLGLDSTLISTLDNDYKKYESSINEVKYLESLMLEFDEKIIKNESQSPNILVSSKNQNIVVIKLKNAANIEKEIILSYTN
jgi:hypothetical protein